MSEQVGQLVSLGLTRYEAAVYLTLLERQDFTPTQQQVQALAVVVTPCPLPALS